MSLFSDIKAKADANGDGKVNKDDLEALRDDMNGDKIDQLKSVADQNGDGKLTLDDVKNFDLGDTFDEAKNSLFGDN
ncbi:MAG: hypothetical protein U5L95_02990 [Candidatus Saccharibacteria bacterium]|nr:hypothetical protein [Candidatus Saccharibacteria bacterium]